MMSQPALSWMMSLSWETMHAFEKERVFDFLLTSAMTLGWYKVISDTIPVAERSEKRLSWIPTLLCSIVASVGCLPLVISGYQQGYPSEIMYANDRLSRFVLNFFVCYLLWDTLFIYRDYPTVGGYLHHVPYFIFMGLALYYRCPGVFVVFLPMEISSIFLAVGHIWPKQRQDYLFGFTFFVGRIIYHFLLWKRLYETRADSPFFIWPFPLLPLGVHVHWFYKWARSMLRQQQRNSNSNSNNSNSSDKSSNNSNSNSKEENEDNFTSKKAL